MRLTNMVYWFAVHCTPEGAEKVEYVWYIAAALAAGVGTGLAGLSAATVMVPILIVLCPSFSGQTGAYQATAIALASDILGSAFTAAVYMRHGNSDLRRAGVLFACVIAMCVTGSVAAFHVGNVVLGSFSLILCLGIGIRFLVRPDTEKDRTVAAGTRLGAKEIGISVFFGLTIGFGTGFVGSGGGMMMLVVFTVFLGMARKAAVGTSTFIMTFTAAIAFVSHAMIDPAIVLERTDALVICIITATAASIVSARFANRVPARTVGLVTGWVLTGLGALLLILNYWPQISQVPLVVAVFQCMGRYLIFLGIIVAAILLIRRFFRVPREIARKLLHLPAVLSVPFLYYASSTWVAAVLCALIFCLGVYPVLRMAEHSPRYAQLLVERRPGEVKRSLFLLFGTDAALLAVCCLLGAPYVAIASILIWGVGDTAAALVGKKFGRHHVHLTGADQKKTWEGTGGMAATAAITGVLYLALASPLPLWQCVLFSIAVAPAAAMTELFSHHGNDTFTVPVATAAVLGLLVWLASF